MKFIVLSDTHRYNNNAEFVIEKYIDDVKGVIHLGDMVDDAKHLKYKYPHLEFHFISGNNDFDFTVPYEKKLTINGKKILITHGHRQRVNMGTVTISYWASENMADAVLFGHTHTPVCIFDAGVYIFNPGSISFPRGIDRPTFGFMDINDDGRISFEVYKIEENGEVLKIGAM